MVLMAAAAADAADEQHNPAAKSSVPSSPPAPAGSTRTRLHGFSFPTTFSWGAHRLLRCSKNGGEASATAPAPALPTEQKQLQQQQQKKNPSLGKEKGQEAAGVGASQPSRPWNLRSRRSGTAAPGASRSEAAAGKAAAAAGQGTHPPAPTPVVAKKRGFSIALTREEIVADFIAIRGTPPPRRPKKRPRAVQNEIDSFFPGLSLADVKLDSYKIVEEK